jgi:hypothetical protein
MEVSPCAFVYLQEFKKASPSWVDSLGCENLQIWLCSAWHPWWNLNNLSHQHKGPVNFPRSLQRHNQRTWELWKGFSTWRCFHLRLDNHLLWRCLVQCSMVSILGLHSLDVSIALPLPAFNKSFQKSLDIANVPWEQDHHQCVRTTVLGEHQKSPVTIWEMKRGEEKWPMNSCSWGQHFLF